MFNLIERHPCDFESKRNGENEGIMQLLNISRFALHSTANVSAGINSMNSKLHITQPILSFCLEFEPFDSQTSATTTRNA